MTLADRVMQETPKFVMVCGLPGSGKSYFGHKLAMLLSGRYLNSDVLRKAKFQNRTYSDHEKAQVYASMLHEWKKEILKECSIVVDATFHTFASRKPFLEQATKHLTVIKVWANETIIKERLAQSRPYSEADFGIYELIRDTWEPLTVPHLVLESTNINIQDMLEEALKYIEQQK